MSTPDVLLTGGTGRKRPGRPWRRTTASQLALLRLAASVEDASGRYTQGSVARSLLDDAHALIRRAAALPEPIDPTST